MLKDNWNETRDRYVAWWNGESVDRPPVMFDTIGAWRNPMYHGTGYDYQRYGEDVEQFCADFEAVWESRSGCRDDTVPCIAPQMGGAIEAAFWAGEINWGRETANLVPHNPLEDMEDLTILRFDPGNEYYQRLIRELRIISKRSGGRYGVNVEASTSITTTISQLRGGTEFMLDTVDRPEEVRALAEAITDVLIRVQNEADSSNPLPEGTAHRWLNYWNPGRGFWFSEDDAIMLSPEMYRDIFLDLDKRLCASTEYAVIHWHTAGMHLIEPLLEIENLKMVQLSFDPNGPDLDTVLDHCVRIEEAGRKVCFQASFSEERLRSIFSKLRPDSCMFYFGYAESIAKAHEILACVERLARQAGRRRSE